MQRIQPYTISFLNYSFANNNEPQKERVLRGIMVTSEATRSGNVSFKTRTNWDEMASTQYSISRDGAEELNYWTGMSYALVSEICGSIIIDDTDAADECWEWFQTLPEPLEFNTVDHVDYFKMLKERFPEIEIRLEPNGF